MAEPRPKSAPNTMWSAAAGAPPATQLQPPLSPQTSTPTTSTVDINTLSNLRQTDLSPTALQTGPSTSSLHISQLSGVSGVSAMSAMSSLLRNLQSQSQSSQAQGPDPDDHISDEEDV